MQLASRSRYLMVVESTAAMLLLVYPTLMLTVRGGMNGSFLLMLLLALVVWIKRPAELPRTRWEKEWTIYAVSMLALTIAVFLSQSFHQQYSGHPYDAPSRYWLAIPVFLLLRRLDLKVFRSLQYAFPMAAITGFLLARDVNSTRAGIQTLDVIHFGNFELILGMLSLLCLDWFGKDKWWQRVIKVLGFLAGLAASVASGSRGGWLAIPVFAAILLYVRVGGGSIRTVMAVVSATIALPIMLYFLNPNFQQRVTNLTQELVALKQGAQDTSTGIRWQLYKAAAAIFVEHPVFGVGPNRFASEMTPMEEAGKLTPQAAELGRGEVHNDILSKASQMGIFGLVAMLSLYLVPLWMFRKAARSTSDHARRAGIQGMVFVSGFVVFGLTAEALNLTMAAAFYGFTVAVLLAACYNVNQAEAIAAR